METVNEVQSFFDTRSEVRLAHRNEKSESRKRPSILGWCRILRVHYQGLCLRPFDMRRGSRASLVKENKAAAYECSCIFSRE